MIALGVDRDRRTRQDFQELSFANIEHSALVAYEDVYFFDMEEEDEPEDDLGEYLVEYLLNALDPIERDVYSRLIFDQQKVLQRNTPYPVMRDGRPVFDETGRPKYHDHKWVGRRLASGKAKMLAAIEGLPPHIRTRLDDIKERLINE